MMIFLRIPGSATLQGELRFSEKVTIARFSLEWLTDGADAP
jgi:hypothetical protein